MFVSLRLGSFLRLLALIAVGAVVVGFLIVQSATRKQAPADVVPSTTSCAPRWPAPRPRQRDRARLRYAGGCGRRPVAARRRAAATRPAAARRLSRTPAVSWSVRDEDGAWGAVRRGE
jgi:hypothetical protein